jgi:hypothetical protein
MSIVRRSTTAIIAATALFSVAPQAHAQRNSSLERYSSQAAFESRYATFGANHYRVVDINLCRDASPTRWWVVVYHRDPAFTPDGANALVWAQPSLPSLRTIALALEAGQMKIDDIDASTPPFGTRDPTFVALQNVAPGRQVILAQFQLPPLHAEIAAHQGDGLELIDFEINSFNSGPHYFGLMREGAPQANLLRESSWAALEARRVAMAGDGWRLRNVAARSGEFWGLFTRGSGPQTAGLFQDWGALSERFSEVDNNGTGTMRLDDVECFRDGGARYIGTWSVMPGRVREHPEVGPRPAPPPRPRTPRRPTRPPVERDPG